jgi:predicted  nucleic acid-binding Zn-ribbon protein
MSTAELRALLSLQDLDTHIDQEMHRKAALPQRAELAQLERALHQVAAARAELVTAQSEVAARQQMAEKELKATEERVNQVNALLYGGTVSASRELQALSSDVDGLKKRISDLEDRVLTLMDEREPLDIEMGRLDEQLAVLGERRQALTAGLGESEAEVDAALEGLSGRRPGVLAAVPPALVPTYERLRARLGGVAVSRLVGGRCDGCHLALPAVELDRIRHHDAGALEYCDQCGRILVVPYEEAT